MLEITLGTHVGITLVAMLRTGTTLHHTTPVLRTLQAAHVAGEFDRCGLHAVTDAEIGNAVLPGVPNGIDLALETALAKPPWHQDGVVAGP